jgi:glycerophosphoryl diester phosphodiesterase
MKRIFFIWFVIPLFAFSQEKIVAHRGVSSLAPENTLAAFQLAINMGLDFMEADIRTTRDDTIVVIHDETIDRTTNGTGWVNQYSYHDLMQLSAGYPSKFGSEYEGEEIPTLFEVLELAKGRINLCIDMKNVPEGFVIDLISKMNMNNQVYLMSYNLDKLKRVLKMEQEIKTIFLTNTPSAIDVFLASEAGAYAVGGSYLFAGYYAEKAHQSGLEYWVGVVDDPAKVENLFREQVDGVITNYPQFLTSIHEDPVRVAPNPFREVIEIQLLNPDRTEKLWITNTEGKEIYRFEKPYGSKHFWKPGESVPKGLYLVYLITDETITFEKILYID